MVANKLRPLIMEKKIIPIIIAIGLNPIKGKKKEEEEEKFIWTACWWEKLGWWWLIGYDVMDYSLLSFLGGRKSYAELTIAFEAELLSPNSQPKPPMSQCYIFFPSELRWKLNLYDFFFFFDIGPLIFLNYLLRDDDDLPFLPESRVMVYPRLFYLQLHYNGEAILQPFLQERRGNQGLGFCLLCLVIKGWSESLSSFWIVILFLLSQFFHIFWR